VVREKAAVARATVAVWVGAEKRMLTEGGVEAAGWAAVWAGADLALGLVVAQEATVRGVAG
jgi:hypothetical protein